MEEKLAIFSIIGEHAKETKENILSRKKKEIKETGRSFWLIRSVKAKVEDIQNICQLAQSGHKKIFCFFLEPSQKNGAQPTKTEAIASQFSADSLQWKNIPKGIKVTGKIDKRTAALVFKNLEICPAGAEVDLWEYSNFLNPIEPIRFSLGASTFCSIKKYNPGLKSRKRRIVAKGELVYPFAVWLK